MSFEQINLNNDFQIQIVQYDNLYSNSFRTSDIWQWSEWLNKLQIPMIHSDKYKRGLVVYGDIADGKDNKGRIQQKYRKDENIINRTAIALDYDDINDLKELYQSIKDNLKSYAWFFHSTHSHTTDKPRIRLIVPLNEPISAKDYRNFAMGLAQRIGHKVDDASFVPSQAMALPVKKSNESEFTFKYNDAPAITRDVLKAMVVKDETITVNYSNQRARRDSSYWCDIAFGVVEGERNQALASLVGLLLRKYVEPELVYGLVSAWAQQCNPPIDGKELNNTFNSIFNRHKKNTVKGVKK